MGKLFSLPWKHREKDSLPPPAIPQSALAGRLPFQPHDHHGHVALQNPYYAPVHIVVNQNHYCVAATPAGPAQASSMQRLAGSSRAAFSKLNLGSVADLATDLLPLNVPHLFDDGLSPWHAHGSCLLNQGAALCDQLSSKFDRVLTSMDCNRYTNDAHMAYDLQSALGTEVGRSRDGKAATASSAVAPSATVSAHFARVNLYANSRLPLSLPQMRLYTDTYRLLTLASTYSERVYDQPQGAERFSHISADWRNGTKAMVIKSVPMDRDKTIVFAIRGTATFMDWAVNLNMAPASPDGFLDDPGNLCHAGFLSVARKMVLPVAARLQQLLHENPGRASHSPLITGHSAGGAVASLLYSHMLATSPEAASELNALATRFRRIHCITFGTPPVSLLPLATPERRALKKSQFLSFVNEGDPVARADKSYVKSLLELFMTRAPAKPATGAETGGSPAKRRAREAEKEEKGKQGKRGKKRKKEGGELGKEEGHSKNQRLRPTSPKTPQGPFKSAPSTKAARSKGGGKHARNPNSHEDEDRDDGPVWNVPPATLSNAGRIVVMRSGNLSRTRRPKNKTIEERLNEGVVAQFTTDEQLRTVIWGDPMCHDMRLYAGRIQTLAIGAVVHQN